MRDASPLKRYVAEMTNSNDLANRKADHIDIVLSRDVGFGDLTAGFDQIQFEHCALPEFALSDVDLTTECLGKTVRAPILISSMTGGPAQAEKINENLCIAAQSLGIPLGVGSQRVALEEQGAGGLSTSLRLHAPTIPIFGNIGGAQLRDGSEVDRARAAIDMIEADGLFVHLNPLQEAVQRGGDTDWRGVRDGIQALTAAKIPVIVKEVGFGLSATVIRELMDIGVTMFDVAGAGGTNWARVEGARSAAKGEDAIAAAFTEWGIPTATAVKNARDVAPMATIIASGGVRNGVDAAKAIRLGANLVGQAAATLAGATTSPEAVIDHFTNVIETLRIACFCTGSKNLEQLRTAQLLSVGAS